MPDCSARGPGKKREILCDFGRMSTWVRGVKDVAPGYLRESHLFGL